MTQRCPFCKEDISEEARVCPLCGSQAMLPCDFCSEWIPALSKTCRFCRSDLSSPYGGTLIRPRSQQQIDRRKTIALERSVPVALVLSLVTLGVYGYYLHYAVAQELGNHHGKKAIHPLRDVVLSIATLGVYGIYSIYRYCRLLQEVSVEEGLPGRDVMLSCLILWVLSCAAFMGMIFATVLGVALEETFSLGIFFGPCCFLYYPGLGLISLLILQHALNQHWAAHRVIDVR